MAKAAIMQMQSVPTPSLRFFSAMIEQIKEKMTRTISRVF